MIFDSVDFVEPRRACELLLEHVDPKTGLLKGHPSQGISGDLDRALHTIKRMKDEQREMLMNAYGLDSALFDAWAFPAAELFFETLSRQLGVAISKAGSSEED